IGQTYPNTTYPNSPQTSYGGNRLTGTYRLDPSKSDDPAQAADRATQSVAYGDRTGLRDQLAARLESPDQIAIDVRGRDVTIGSSRAPQITFSADGVERVETTSSGRTIRARATLSGDQLMVSSTGDVASEFNVTFSPIDNGSKLSVTRRVYVQGLSRPVVVQSTYDKTADVARFDINTGPQAYPTTPNSGTDFILANGETVVAALDNGLSTANAREGDRFTLTVRQPSQYDGATIEGHVSNVQRSGRLTGRSQMTLNYDTIRLRDGRSYRFAGILNSVRTPQGETINVDNEGSVRDDNQTTKTAQRAAIGTAVGAIIGAIAGGGKGAAIGAIVGAGGGAGSVYVQGRDDLELARGSELTIRASGPR
ncbi:MAG: YMGG-like glycine zipper-containing protein, partial [Acidobacteriota bacterium]|nr:YMGG-like glycine zipper-containing protein [Acidobacteriota bacterium]